MTEHEKNTEQQILEAAKTIFILKGFDGARMQDIADEAGINKALLHYYFRSKEKLFDGIFQMAFQHFMPKVTEAMMQEMPFPERIQLFASTYIQMLQEHPQIPIFVLHEINRNPERLVELFKGHGIKPEIFMGIIMNEITEGRMKPIDPRHLMTNIIALCIFPFAAKPMLIRLFFNNDEEQYQNFIEERKKIIPEIILKSIEYKGI